jgi:hypothetical protein
MHIKAQIMHKEKQLHSNLKSKFSSPLISIISIYSTFQVLGFFVLELFILNSCKSSKEKEKQKNFT